jgi:adenylate kinase family enzyme
MNNNIKPQAFILIGRSGCGKGTQGKLIQDYLKKIDSDRELLYIQTGAEFRNFIKETGYTQSLSKKVYDNGDLQPEFLAAAMWLNVLIREFKGNEHIIFDGTPRKFHEAGTLDSIFDFYGFDRPYVLNIVISREESVKRLLLRKRIDDIKEEIEKRLNWYESDVVPAINFYKNNKRYNYLEIDGEKSVEDINKDIISRLGL